MASPTSTPPGTAEAIAPPYAAPHPSKLFAEVTTAATSGAPCRKTVRPRHTDGFMREEVFPANPAFPPSIP